MYSGVFVGKEAAEGYTVFSLDVSGFERYVFQASSEAVARRFAGHFAGSCLSGDFDYVVAQKFGCASLFPNDVVHHAAEYGGVFTGKYAVADIRNVYRRVAPVGQAQAFDKTWTHKASVVGYGVVESAGVERRYHGGVAEYHAREIEASAVSVLSFGK